MSEEENELVAGRSRGPAREADRDGGSRASSGFDYQDAACVALAVLSELGREQYDAFYVEVDDDILARIGNTGPDYQYDVIQVTTQRPSGGFWRPNSAKLVKAVRAFAKLEQSGAVNVRKYVFYASGSYAATNGKEKFQADLVSAALRVSDEEDEPFIRAVVKRIEFPAALPYPNHRNELLIHYVGELLEASTTSLKLLRAAMRHALQLISERRVETRDSHFPSLIDQMSDVFSQGFKQRKMVTVEEVIASLHHQAEVAPPTPNDDEASRSQYARDIANRAKHWSVVSLVTLGLPAVEAEEFVTSEFESEVDERLLPSSDHPLTYIHGPLGAGKSFFARKLAFKYAQTADCRSGQPYPVLLRTRELSSDLSVNQLLERQLYDAKGIQNCRIAVIADGVDELGPERMNRVISELCSLVAERDNVVCVVTSRVALSQSQSYAMPLPPLTRASAERLVAAGSGGGWERQFDLLRMHLGDAILNPLFAWLSGLALREGIGVTVESRNALVKSVVSRALFHSPLETGGQVFDELVRIAALAIERPAQAIDRSELARSDLLDSLLRTGLIGNSGRKLAFALPFVCEWFASQALRDQATRLRATSGREVSDAWREALVFAFDWLSTQDIDECLSRLAERDAGFLLDLLDALHHIRAKGAIELPNSLTCAKRLEMASTALQKAFNEVSFLFVNLVDDAGKSLVPAAWARGSLLAVEWRRAGDRSEGPVDLKTEELEPNIRFRVQEMLDRDSREVGGWVEIRGANQKLAYVASSPAWPWFWVRKEVESDLEHLVKEKLLTLDRGPLVVERNWHVCKELGGISKSSAFEPEIDVEAAFDRLTKAILEAGTNRVAEPFWNGASEFEIDDLLTAREYLRSLLARGIKKTRGEQPQPDVQDPKSTLISDGFTSDGLASRLKYVIEQGQIAYLQFVEHWFPRLKPRMEHAVFFPACFKCALFSSKRGMDMGFPSLTYYLAPLPTGVKPAAEITVLADDGASSYSRQNWTDSDLRTAQDSLQRLREFVPQGLGYHASVGVLPVSVMWASPIREAVYGWLAEDLRRLGIQVRYGGWH